MLCCRGPASRGAWAPLSCPVDQEQPEEGEKVYVGEHRLEPGITRGTVTSSLPFCLHSRETQHLMALSDRLCSYPARKWYCWQDGRDSPAGLVSRSLEPRAICIPASSKGHSATCRSSHGSRSHPCKTLAEPSKTKSTSGNPRTVVPKPQGVMPPRAVSC